MTKYLFVLLLLAGTVFGEGDIQKFGPTDTAGYSTATQVGEARANTESGHLYTAGTADTVQMIHYFFKRGDATPGDDSITFAIYTIPDDTIAVTRVGITARCLIGDVTALGHWDSVAFPTGIVLTEGVQYCLAFGDEAGDVDRFYKSGGSANKSVTTTLEGAWSSDGTVPYSTTMYADIDTTDGATVKVHLRKVHVRDVDL